MKYLSVILLFISNFAWGQCQEFQNVSFKQLPFEMLFHYRQSRMNLKDSESDHALITHIKSNLKNPLNFQTTKDPIAPELRKRINELRHCALERFDLHEVESEISVDDDIQESVYSENKVAPFKVKKLANMFNRVIQEEALQGIRPTTGEFHRWSETHLPYTLFSKVLWALSRGETSRYMVTGLEVNLKQWILTQENNSISLDKIFRRSYQLNQGNIYLTLLAIENVLSNDWQNPNRQQFLTTKKLKKFTNTIGNDDRFGHWYHLFGVMLYGYVKSGIRAAFVGRMESLSSVIMKQQHEDQEKAINIQGGKVGNLLHRWIQNGSWEKRPTNAEFTTEAYYLE